MYRGVKKYTASKNLLLKIFIYQQKNKLSLKVKLKQANLGLLCFL
jgi:hypothetical protein